MTFYCSYLKEGKPYQCPRKANEDDAGADFFAAESKILFPLLPRRIKTNTVVAVPKGQALLLKDRSGLGSRGFHVLAGVVDCGYRGDVSVCIINLNLFNPLRWFKKIKVGDRIAQGLVVSVSSSSKTVSKIHMPPSRRGASGFGGSGR